MSTKCFDIPAISLNAIYILFHQNYFQICLQIYILKKLWIRCGFNNMRYLHNSHGIGVNINSNAVRITETPMVLNIF